MYRKNIPKDYYFSSKLRKTGQNLSPSLPDQRLKQYTLTRYGFIPYKTGPRRGLLRPHILLEKCTLSKFGNSAPIKKCTPYNSGHRKRHFRPESYVKSAHSIKWVSTPQVQTM